MRTVLINGVEYKLRYSLRGLFLFERIADHPYRGTAFDLHILFYACLLESNEDFKMEMPEFIAACEDDPRLIDAFKGVMEERNARDRAIMTGADDVDVKKKEMPMKS